MTPKVQDQGHRYADKKLAALTKRLQRSYRQARLNLLEKIGAYLERFEKEDAMMRALYDSGELSHQDYMTWRYRKIAGTKQWRVMLDQLTADLVKADKVAASMIRDELPEVYAENHNYGTYEIEHDLQMSTSYTLYNRDAVARLLKENPKLLPNQPNVNVPKDERWNRQHLQSAVMQGILTGESMDKSADRFQYVAAMDERAAMRNARTAVTGAENAGKLDSMKRAIGLGVQLKKMWLATRDQRTRDSHAMMDGELRDIDEPFSNGCMYPGDPDGASAEVYNCRCAMRSKVAGADPYSPDLSRNQRLGGMSYEEWKQQAGERFYTRLFGKDVSLGNNPNQTEQEPWDRSKVQYSLGGSMLKKQLEKSGVEYNEVKLHSKQLSEEDIINRVSGGDKTDGSCVSASLAYIGNKFGYDVLDFRGGVSQKIFSHSLEGILPLEEKYNKRVFGNDMKKIVKLIKSIEEGKEYLLKTGKHATIVRVVKGEYQYLELQEISDNGWHRFEFEGYDLKFKTTGKTLYHVPGQSMEDTLKKRFGCGEVASSLTTTLTDINGFNDSDEFRDFLGYINTSVENQEKGEGGYAK